MKLEDTCRLAFPTRTSAEAIFRLFATTACAIILRAWLEKAILSHQKGGADGQGARLEMDGAIQFDVTGEDNERRQGEIKGVDLP
jgi:hypothetical protein